MRIMNFCLLAVFLALVACSTPQKEIKEYNYSKDLISDSELLFKIDDQTSFSPFTMQYVEDNEDGSQYLFANNKNTLSVDVYDFGKSEMLHRISVNDSSTQLSKGIHGFWAINTDSILAYSQFKLSPVLITLEDWEVSNRKVVRVDASSTGRSFFNHASMTASPSYVHRNKIHYSEMPLADISSLIGTGYSPELIYDLKRDTSYVSGITWPDSYSDSYWGDLFLYLKTYDDIGRGVYSWEACNELMIRDGDSIFMKSAQSDVFDDKLTYDKNLTDGDRDYNRLEKDHYMMVLYDKYRKVYYRYAIQGVERTSQGNKANTPFDQPFSIIILDRAFNKIGEAHMPSGKYNPKDSFVGRDGLYISNHNLRNYDNLGEDVMSFSLFKLKDI